MGPRGPHEEITRDLKKTRARITTARRALTGHDTRSKQDGTSTHEDGLIEANGQRYLTMRRLLGLPDPPNWGERMVRYHLGTAYLLKASENPLFDVQDVPDELRDMLTHPIYDHPATNRELEAIIVTYSAE